MKKRWKMLMAALGAAALVVSQNGVFYVNAEETVDADADVVAEDTNDEEEVVADETEAADDEGEAVSTSPVAVTELGWDDSRPGRAYFKAPNDQGTALYVVKVNGERFDDGYNFSGWDKGEMVELDLFHIMTESGTYTFEVTTYDAKSKTQIGETATSAGLEWNLSNTRLSAPANASWAENGIFSCGNPDNNYVDMYLFELYNSNNKMIGRAFGSYVVAQYVDVTEDENGITFNLNEFLSKNNFPFGDGFYIKVQATSNNPTVYGDSAFAIAYFGNKSPQTESGNSQSSSATVEAKEWKPTTPDEKKRYAVYSKEKVVYTADIANTYPVTVYNAIQGKKCFDSFEAFLMDWNIGRTYNIFPANHSTYKMNAKARITMSIPKALQAQGRAFKMICVTEGGQVVILDDLDSDPNTITFETDTYYAFALIYKDAVVSQ